MSQYQRMISYLYRYENSVKGKNAGYVRIEQRGKDCRLTVQLQDGALSELPVWLFRQQPDGIEKINAGQIRRNGTGFRCRIETESGNMLGSGYAFEEMDGLMIYQNNNLFYATTWRDISIRLGVQHASVGRGGVPQPERFEGENGLEAAQTEQEEKLTGEEIFSGEGQTVSSVLQSREEWEKTVVPEMVSGETEREAVLEAASERGEREAALEAASERAERNAAPGMVSWEQKRIEEPGVNFGGAGQTAGPGVNFGDAERTAGPGMVSWEQERTVGPGVNFGDAEQTAGPEVNSGGAERTEGQEMVSGRELLQGEAEAQRENGNSGQMKFSVSKGRREEIVRDKEQIRREKKKEGERQSRADQGERPGKEEQPHTARNQGRDVSEQETACGCEQCRYCPQQGEQRDMGTYIMSMFPKMYPFELETMGECVRLELKDIGCLPVHYWSLAGNPFLLQGFYCYRHIIFTKMNREEYCIGVPGIYSRDSQTKAVSCGFGQFQPLSDVPEWQGAFGYWLYPIKLQ